MGEAYLKMFANDKFIAESAGLEAGTLNPFAVKAIALDGIDISRNKTKDVFDFHREGKSYDYVITVCDEANASRCPIFPGPHKKISWSFEDPSSFIGSDDEKLNRTILIRDQIKAAVIDFIQNISE